MPPAVHSTLKLIASGAAFILLAVLAFHLKNNNPEQSRFPPCVIKKVTGFHCPGCGSTRSAHALLNRDISAAWRKNPAFVIALPFIIGGFFLPWLRWILPQHAERIKKYTCFIPHWAPYLALVLLLVFGILRNIPVVPFSLLAPR